MNVLTFGVAVASGLVASRAVGLMQDAWRRRKRSFGSQIDEVLRQAALSHRRDPCAPGGCRYLTDHRCASCDSGLYECEYESTAVRGGLACARCVPFRLDGVPDGFQLSDRCSHGLCLWQFCKVCAALPVNLPEIPCACGIPTRAGHHGDVRCTDVQGHPFTEESQ